MKFVTNVSSFKAGVLSSKLFGRTDTREYAEGLSIGENAFIGKTGGAYKRYGLGSVSQLADDSVAQIETIRLDNNTSVTMVFYSYPSYTPNFSKWRLLDSNGIQITLDYDIQGEVGGFNIVKFEEYLVVTHNIGISPLYIKIDIDGNKPSVSEIRLFNGVSPYSYPQSKVNTVIEDKLRLKGVDQVGGATQMESNGFNIQEVFEVGDWVMITGIVKVGSASRISTGMYRITSFVSTTLADVEAFFYYANPDPVDSMANVTVQVNTSGIAIGYNSWGTESDWFDEWSHSLWTGGRGYPKRVAVDEGRLVFANAGDKKVTMWGSKTNDPFFFLDRRFTSTSAIYAHGGSTTEFNPELPYSGNIVETDPYQFTLSTKHSSQINTMESARNFIVGTDRQEFVISGNNGALSQKNFSSRPHTSHGSAPNLSLVFDNVVLFVSRNRRQIHLFKYSQENGSFLSKELTILNGDPFENDQIKTLDWHEELGICFIVTDNGQLITLTLNEETATAGFTTQPIDGTVLDAAYVVAGDGDEYMSLVIRRGSSTYIDKISPAEIEIASPQIFAIKDKLNYLDNFRFLTSADNGSPVTYFNSVEDYVHYNYSELKIGDTVTFDGPNGITFLAATGLNFGTPYYVIPFKNAQGNIGMRLATSLANAQSNTYIPIATTVVFPDIITTSFARDVQTIPTEHFQVGDIVTVFAKEPFGAVEEFTFTADGNATYDLGKAYSEVAYGQTYSFHIATMPIEAGQQWGSAQLGIKRVDRAGVRVHNTRSFKISTDGYNSEEVSWADPFTGQKVIEVTGNTEFEHIVHIQNDKAEGCFIASLALRGLSNDG